MMLFFAVFLVIISTIIGSIGALYFKLASSNFSLNPRNLIRNWRFFLGALLYFLSTIPFLIALKYGDLTVLYPFLSLGYIWIMVLSIRYLRESMNMWKWLGFTAIIIGVALIGLGAR